MDFDLSDLLGVVVGGVIATVAGLIHSLVAGRQARKAFQEAERARRDAEVRVRADARADEVLKALQEIGRIVSRTRGVVIQRLSEEHFFPEDHDGSVRIRKELASIESACEYLPQPTRGDIELAIRLMSGADEMACRGFLSGSPKDVGREVLRFARDAVGPYLRSEPPLDRPEKIGQYERAHSEWVDWLVDEFERQEADAGAADAVGREADDGGGTT